MIIKITTFAIRKTKRKTQKKVEREVGGKGNKGAKSAEKSRKEQKRARFSQRKEHVPMSSEAPSPSAAVLARRASREAKSMREESGSEEDCDEPVEWEDDDEVASEEDGSEEEVRVSNAQRGRVRLHWASQSSTGLEVDDERRKSLGEKGWARRAVVVRGVEPSGAADFEAVPGREEYDLGEDGSAAWAQDMLEFADDN